MATKIGRRKFVTAMAVGTAAAGRGGELRARHSPSVPHPKADAKPALLGGEPVRQQAFPSWPVIDEGDRSAWKGVLESGTWNRGPMVERFETTWARRLGCAHAIATSSGTSALYTCLAALDVGPGDEVIVPPYTFVATINVVLLRFALPVFVDTDRTTFQIDAQKFEAAITSRTRCIIPVHLGGNVADMDKILEVAAKHRIPVLEDACQAHFAEWRERKVGTLGTLGCFSFQASKNLNSGEGGAITGHDPELMKACASFQNAGRGYSLDADSRLVPDANSMFAYVRNGDNRRITEFQGTLLLEQLARLEEQAKRREENAQYLTAQLREIAGIEPARMYEGCTRNAYHLYMFRYDPAAFAGLSRERFIKALSAEGIPCSAGYSPLNREPFIKRTLESRFFQKIYPAGEISDLRERNNCPENDRLCSEAVWLTQTMLLGPRSDMDDIASAVAKLKENAAALSRA